MLDYKQHVIHARTGWKTKNADAEPAEESLEQAATIVDAPETDKKDGDPDVIAADENVKRTVGSPLKTIGSQQTQSWLLSLNIWLLLFVFVSSGGRDCLL